MSSDAHHDGIANVRDTDIDGDGQRNAADADDNADGVADAGTADEGDEPCERGPRQDQQTGAGTNTGV